MPDRPPPEYKPEYAAFLAPLLASAALSGVLLLDRHGMPAYEHGDLDHRAGTRLTQHVGRVKENPLCHDDERSLKYLFDVPVDPPSEAFRRWLRRDKKWTPGDDLFASLGP